MESTKFVRFCVCLAATLTFSPLFATELRLCDNLPGGTEALIGYDLTGKKISFNVRAVLPEGSITTIAASADEMGNPILNATLTPEALKALITLQNALFLEDPAASVRVFVENQQIGTSDLGSGTEPIGLTLKPTEGAKDEIAALQSSIAP